MQNGGSSVTAAASAVAFRDQGGPVQAVRDADQCAEPVMQPVLLPDHDAQLASALQLFEDGGVSYLLIPGEQQRLGHDFGGLGVVVGERQEEPAAVL